MLPALQWNIERGYKLAAVIAELAACDADVIALQEVDIGCDRSGGEDTGRPSSLGGDRIFCIRVLSGPACSIHSRRREHRQACLASSSRGPCIRLHPPQPPKLEHSVGRVQVPGSS